jgi:hypothetical protein
MIIPMDPPMQSADSAPDDHDVILKQDFWRFLRDDMALLQAARARWTLVPAADAERSAQSASDSIDATQNGQRHEFGLRIALPETAVEICTKKGVLVGRSAAARVRLDSPMVSI